jgi:hypothetical protein
MSAKLGYYEGTLKKEALYDGRVELREYELEQKGGVYPAKSRKLPSKVRTNRARLRFSNAISRAHVPFNPIFSNNYKE